MPAPADKPAQSAAVATPESTDFESVAESVAPRLYRMAMRMCGKREDAEDLVQDTLLQGFRKWGQFEQRSAPSTWLYTIAARLCQRRRRRRSGEPLRLEPLSELLPSPSDPVLALPAAGNGPLDEHLKREAERAVAAALAGLPEHVRLPLVLADIAELSTAEIARILGLKEATVKTRIHRARLMVRRVLLGRLSVRPAPPATHDRHMCLDLLRAKQEAMDRRAPFPFSSEELCDRCQAVFATLDLGRNVCRVLGGDALPESLRALIRTHHAEPDGRRRPAARARGTHRTRP
jgi:RNA polymerase sigma-70 factor (ECF subfamily)